MNTDAVTFILVLWDKLKLAFLKADMHLVLLFSNIFAIGITLSLQFSQATSRAAIVLADWPRSCCSQIQPTTASWCRCCSARRALPMVICAWRIWREPGALFIQETVCGQHQHPEPEKGGRAHQLILVQAEQIFAIREEHLDGPARRDVLHEQRHVSHEAHWKPRSGAQLADAHAPCSPDNVRRVRTRVETTWT
jgi:hypothetical protein